MAFEPALWALARKLQAIAQTGLTYAVNEHDRHRYRAVGDTAAELMVLQSGTPFLVFRHLFDSQAGYATPKVDVRAAAFRDGRILLVREAADGLWSLPGGWADVNESPREAVEREALEESGFAVKAVKLASVYDRAKHPHEPPFPFHVYKMFFRCEIISGAPKISAETTAVEFHAPDALPPLSLSRVLPRQVERLFEHLSNPPLPKEFD